MATARLAADFPETSGHVGSARGVWKSCLCKSVPTYVRLSDYHYPVPVSLAHLGHDAN